jgi:hypothetical protein
MRAADRPPAQGIRGRQRQETSMALITVKILRTDGGKFDSRQAFVETTPLNFNAAHTATLNKASRPEKYRLTWMVTGAPGEYQVQITTPDEAVDKDANARKRRIDVDGFGAGQRRFTVNS